MKNSKIIIWKMYKNIILDRDGIINHIVNRNGIISSPWNVNEFKFLEDSKVFLTKLSNSKRLLFIATNQPDISRGNLNIMDLDEMHQLIAKKYKIIEVFCCTHDNRHKCLCRKPKPGMLNEIIRKHKLTCSETVMIGDSYKDIEAATAANIDSVFYFTNYNAKDYDMIEKNTRCTIVKSFSEIEYLLNLN